MYMAGSTQGIVTCISSNSPSVGREYAHDVKLSPNTGRLDPLMATGLAAKWIDRLVVLCTAGWSTVKGFATSQV